MKMILTLLITISDFIFLGSVQGQTTYKITSNRNWSAVLPSTCADCKIIISTGVTLTIDGSYTCQNCSFQGGTISMTSKTLNIQYTGGSPVTTSFDGTNFQVYGTGSIVVNAPLSLTNSTFTFNNTSSIQTSFQVDLSGSTINLYDNASMVSTGSSSTGLTLSKTSNMVIGNGTGTSGASLFVNGPTVNIYKNSSISLGNQNNTYINWANYNTYNNNGNGNGGAASYSTAFTTINCGTGYAHACAGSYVYGPASLSTAGTVAGSLLPVILADFTVTRNEDQTITESWNTQQEVNFSHFELERSQDGGTWSVIGSVPAKGNSSTETDYSFIDRSPLAGVNYYRLKIVDLDGHYDYSEIKVLRSGLVTKTSFFPNPARDYVNVTLGSTTAVEVTIRLINQAGQVLQEKKGMTGNGAALSIPLYQYAAGYYILSVSTADGACESSKLMISRS